MTATSSISTASAADPDPLPDTVAPAFRERTRRALAELSREGPLTAQTGESAWSATVDGTTFAVAVDDASRLVTRARHAGAPDEATRAVLDQVAGFAEGAPVQEVVEHGVVYAMNRLLDRDAPRPVPGILTPRNAGPMFALPLRLVRALRAEYFAKSGEREVENHFDRPYSDRWRSLDIEGKRRLIEPELATFRAAAGLTDADLSIHEIDRYDRVILIFGRSVSPDAKPTLLMELERRLRAATGERIELFAEPARDDNKIRRL